jgi:SAM-dependent methyltransferase
MDDLLRATALAEQHHFWFRGFRWFVEPLVKASLQGRTAPRILDCGCGTGANLGWMTQYGRGAGFDLSPVGVAFARASGRHVVRASVAAVPYQSGLFDLVTSFDVIYSLEERDEAAAVSEMFRLLKPGGTAIINVAAMPSLTGDHSVLSRERRRYTKASLKSLLERHGFSVVRLTYTNATLFLPMWLVRAFHRWRGLSAESDAQQEIAIPPAPVNASMTAMLWLESRWIRAIDNPFGSSLLCVARKP